MLLTRVHHLMDEKSTELEMLKLEVEKEKHAAMALRVELEKARCTPKV